MDLDVAGYVSVCSMSVKHSLACVSSVCLLYQVRWGSSLQSFVLLPHLSARAALVEATYGLGRDHIQKSKWMSVSAVSAATAEAYSFCRADVVSVVFHDDFLCNCVFTANSRVVNIYIYFQFFTENIVY